ncbi:unnamed protein product [Periconia digitata]|uniref:Uncharacterized protein n=1 Tax=Periconia digitata TaxID=1303443 RepID=A0A9W4UDI9_9PLEO|nr:unnamed protein product [Periconia digitata]
MQGNFIDNSITYRLDLNESRSLGCQPVLYANGGSVFIYQVGKGKWETSDDHTKPASMPLTCIYHLLDSSPECCRHDLLIVIVSNHHAFLLQLNLSIVETSVLSAALDLNQGLPIHIPPRRKDTFSSFVAPTPPFPIMFSF